jgi:outer membrane protein assembly factor BamD
MDAMQTFLNLHPDSKYRDQAIEVITVSQQKLERKGYEGAKQYLKVRSYKAAIIAFDNFKKSFPDSNYLEELAYLKVQAQFRLARQSLISLQKERFTSVVEFYKEFIDAYPQSRYVREAEKLYSESQNQINKLKNNS